MNVTQYTQLYREARADLANLEQEVTRLRAVCEYLQLKAGADTASPTSQPRGVAGPFARMRQVDAARQVLRDATSPLKTSEIAKRLIAGGFPATDEARLKTSLFTTMTRKGEMFAKTGPGRWTLKEEGKKE